MCQCSVPLDPHDRIHIPMYALQRPFWGSSFGDGGTGDAAAGMFGVRSSCLGGGGGGGGLLVGPAALLAALIHRLARMANWILANEWNRKNPNENPRHDNWRRLALKSPVHRPSPPAIANPALAKNAYKHVETSLAMHNRKIHCRKEKRNASAHNRLKRSKTKRKKSWQNKGADDSVVIVREPLPLKNYAACTTALLHVIILSAWSTTVGGRCVGLDRCSHSLGRARLLLVSGRCHGGSFATYFLVPPNSANDGDECLVDIDALFRRGFDALGVETLGKFATLCEISDMH